MTRLRSWLRKPALHFAGLGALLYGLEAAVVGASGAWEPPPREPIAIGPEELAVVRADWRARTGRLPDQAELDALVEAELDEEVLYREARRLGLHVVDPLVRQRLVLNMRFLSDDPEADDDELLDEAFRLEMDRSDVVVRRRLVQLMQLQFRALARNAEPSDAELEDLLQRDAARYRRPARARLTQVYLSRDRRGAALARDARDLGRKLRDGPLSPERGAELGDAFLFPAELPLRSERELARTFGPEFARRVLEVESGAWAGPVPSSYGLHWVFVHERREAQDATLESVRRELREAWLEERAERSLREATRRLRARYEVVRAADPAT